MKKLLVVFALTFFAGGAFAEAVITDFDQFRYKVRQLTKIKSTALMPETTLIDICHDAILWTSVDAGGLEEQLVIATIADSQFYDLPDTLVEVVHASLTDENNRVRSLKAWYPEFFSDIGLPGGYDAAPGEDDLPFAYNYWDDRLQLMPIPAKADTVRLNVFVEHPLIDTLTNDLSLDSIILFIPVFTDVAVANACYRTFLTVQEYDKAAVWLGVYEKRKAEARSKYLRKFNAPRQ